MRKFLKTVLFLFALSSIAYAEDDAMAILNKKRAEIEKAEKAKAKLAKEAEEKAKKEAEEQAMLRNDWELVRNHLQKVYNTYSNINERYLHLEMSCNNNQL